MNQRGIMKCHNYIFFFGTLLKSFIQGLCFFFSRNVAVWGDGYPFTYVSP